MRSYSERLKLYGSPEAVAAVDAYLDRLVADAPPLTQGQKARLGALLHPTAPAAPTAARVNRAPRTRAA